MEKSYTKFLSLSAFPRVYSSTHALERSAEEVFVWPYGDYVYFVFQESFCVAVYNCIASSANVHDCYLV